MRHEGHCRVELVVRLWPLGDGVRAAAEEPSGFGLDCDWFVMAILYLKPREELGYGSQPCHQIPIHRQELNDSM